MTRSQFADVARIITKNFEGGYYHPLMQTDGRMKPNPVYRNSGETMFGIDRKAGAPLRNFNPAGWDRFWREIDNSGAARSWKWNYRGGPLESKLQDLTTDVMQPVYEAYATQYLTAAAKKIVEADPLLFLHFAYGAWNGPGWFQKYARVTNAGVATDKPLKTLQTDAINYRINSSNSIIAKTGRKLKGLFSKSILPAISGGSAAVIIGILGVLLLSGKTR